MTTQSLPYCGAPPVPGDLLHRFNADPLLIAALALIALAHWRAVRTDRRNAALAAADFSALVAPADPRVLPAADAARGPVWSFEPVCASALAAAAFCALVAVGDASVLPAADAARGPV